ELTGSRLVSATVLYGADSPLWIWRSTSGSPADRPLADVRSAWKMGGSIRNYARALSAAGATVSAVGRRRGGALARRPKARSRPVRQRPGPRSRGCRRHGEVTAAAWVQANGVRHRGAGRSRAFAEFRPVAPAG